MRPFNTVHDVSIKRKTVDEALALLPIWLHDLLLTLWQKKWEILFAILTNNNNIICMKSVCSTCWRLCRLLCWPDHPICKHWRLFITSCPGKEFVILVQIFILQITQDYIRKEAEYDWVQVLIFLLAMIKKIIVLLLCIELMLYRSTHSLQEFRY